VRAAVLVPVKRFTAAKGRLASVLSNADRARLAEWMATGVLAAVADLPTYLACDDEDVRRWALANDAQVLWGPGLGLNGAVDDGVARIAADGHDHVIVTHADLARPWGLADLVAPRRITLVPDTRRDGTNVMAFPLTEPIRASYGAGSFARHLAQAELARRRGVEVVGVDVRDDPDLSLDVDTPEDLARPLVKEVLPEWVRTSPASRHSA
jgi:2-phospho-L-lactate guanylyltransferase